MCHHLPACPPADSAGRRRARIVDAHPDQGWSRLCNGLILFEDGGEMLTARFSARHRCSVRGPVYYSPEPLGLAV